MKRLLFAGIILFGQPVFAQYKAGKTDTVRTVIIYADTNATGNAVYTSLKEQHKKQITRNHSKAVYVLPGARRNANLSAKELMKAEVTRMTGE